MNEYCLKYAGVSLTGAFDNILAKLLIFDTPKRAFLIDMDSIIMCNDFAPFASKFKSL